MNPYQASMLTPEMAATLQSLRRLDKKGYLYEMDCLWDYNDPRFSSVLARFHLIDAGCSVFTTFTPKGGVLTCRNYDYNHRRGNQKDAPQTGVNLVLHCAHKGKYRSVAVSDVFWMDSEHYYDGTLDDGHTDITPLPFLPYCCMDGMNEKGLTVSILAQSIREGETAVSQNQPGKAKIGHTILLRRMLDECADIHEALTVAESVNIISHNGSDYRLFVSDKNGESVVLEWRYDQLTPTFTNAATNFYVGFDDAADRMRNGRLVEKAIQLKNTAREYHYGYGRGYQRFAVLVSQLEFYRNAGCDTYRTEMDLRHADSVIRSVIQNTTPEATSLTQYSSIYDQQKLRLHLRSLPGYGKQYHFQL